MESKLSPVPVPPELSSGQPQARPAASRDRAELSVPAYPPAPSADLRLVMEEILKMMSEQRYTAGVVISTIA